MKKIRVIVAGSRDCSDYLLVSEAIEKGMLALGLTNVDEFVHGDATGVDKTAGIWAKNNGYNVVTFPAKWNDIHAPGAVVKVNKFGKKYNVNAGFDRNREMAEYATHLIAIDLNTNGTNHMIETMKKLGKPVYQYKPSHMEDDEFDEYDFWGNLHASL